MNRCLRAWGLNRNVRLSESNGLLKQEIGNHFWGSKTDEEISEKLRRSLAVEITYFTFKLSLIERPRQVRYVRNMEGLKRTTKLTDEELNEIILAQKNNFGVQGIRKTTQHLKDVCQIWASRGRVQKTLHRLDPSYGRKPYQLWKKKGAPPSTGNGVREQSLGRNANISSEDMSYNEMSVYNDTEDGLSEFADEQSVEREPIADRLAQINQMSSNSELRKEVERLFTENENLKAMTQALLEENTYLQQENAKLVEDNRSLRGEVEGLTTNNQFLRAENEKLSNRTVGSASSVQLSTH